MGWPEKVKGGFRGRYRLPNGDKPSVYQPDGDPFPTAPKARKAANDAEIEARRKSAQPKKAAARRSAKYPPDVHWGVWWDHLATKRTFNGTGTADTEASIVRRHLRPQWDTVPLNQIINKNPAVHAGQVGVQEWIDSPSGLATRRGMSPGYAHRVFSVFSASIHAAVDEEIIDELPLKDLKLPKIPKKKRPYLPPSKVAEFELRDDYDELLVFAAHTGLRPGEVCGLHIHRCDLKRGFITVAEVFVERRRIIRHYPKDDDHRDVPLTPVALDIVKKRIAGRDHSGKCPFPHFNGEECLSPLVFMTAYNRAYRPSSARNVMHRAAGKRKLQNTGGMYSTRHGFGTTAANNNMNLFDVSDIMGHANLKTTKQYFQGTDGLRDRITTAFSDQ